MTQKEIPISTIIPVLGEQGNIFIPLYLKFGTSAAEVTVKMDKDAARDLGQRLIKLSQEKPNDQ